MGCNSSKNDIYAARRREAKKEGGGSVKRLRGDKNAGSGSILSFVETSQWRHRWLASENKNLAVLHPDDIPKFESLFRKLLSEESSQEELTYVSRGAIERTFEKMGLNLQKNLLNKVFSIFDVDGYGKVDHTAFVVAMAYLMRRCSADDNVALLFRLFDSNCSNSISQLEFNSMMNAIVSNRLEDLLELDVGLEAFEAHLRKEHSAESIEFWKAIRALKARSRDSESSVSSADAKLVYDTFISSNAESQINIGSATTKRLSDMFLTVKSSPRSRVSAQIFDGALDEVLGTMRRDNYARFKGKILSTCDFAEAVWKKLNIDPKGGMSVKEFSIWTKQNPAVFNFLTHLQKEMQLWLAQEQIRLSRVETHSSSKGSPTVLGKAIDEAIANTVGDM